MSREEAEELLNQALTRGEVVLQAAGGVRDETSFSDWTSEATRWRKFATSTLQRVSDGSALEEELIRVSKAPRIGVIGGSSPTVSERLERRQRTHVSEMNVVRSVVERLPLFPAPAADPLPPERALGSDVFVVHGRQLDSAEIVARFVERLGLKAIILDEQPNLGRTLIEKFEANSQSVGFAVVLMTADDWARGPDDEEWPDAPNRARQNVVLELGYFVGRLGREHVAALVGQNVEQPSDTHGLAYIPFDDGWKMRLLREMKVVFPDLDANLAFGTE